MNISFPFSPVRPAALSALSLVLTAMLPMSSAQARTDATASPRQQGPAITDAVEQFLHVQSAALPGKVSISVASVDPQLNLPACLAPQPFLPPNSRLWGKTAIGVRCTAPEQWTIYVMATVRVRGDYVAAAGPLVYGQLIGPADITSLQGDLTALPHGILTDPEQVIGRTAARSLQAGMPIRHDSVRNPRAVQQGQTVKVVSTGPGFSVASEGRALSNGTDGQLVRARTANGQVVSGLARAGGVVEVIF